MIISSQVILRLTVSCCWAKACPTLKGSGTGMKCWADGGCCGGGICGGGCCGGGCCGAPLRRLVSDFILCTSAKVYPIKVSLQVSAIFSSSFPSQEPHTASELMLTGSNIELIWPWRRELSACWVWIVCSTSGSRRAFERPLVLSPGFALWCEVCGCWSSGSGSGSALGSARGSGSCSSSLLESPEGGGAGCEAATFFFRHMAMRESMRTMCSTRNPKCRIRNRSLSLFGVAGCPDLVWVTLPTLVRNDLK